MLHLNCSYFSRHDEEFVSWFCSMSKCLLFYLNQEETLFIHNQSIKHQTRNSTTRKSTQYNFFLRPKSDPSLFLPFYLTWVNVRLCVITGAADMDGMRCFHYNKNLNVQLSIVKCTHLTSRLCLYLFPISLPCIAHLFPITNGNLPLCHLFLVRVE